MQRAPAPSPAAPCSPAPDPCEGVEQVGSRVPSVIQHLVKGEHVIIESVVGQICVFNASKSHRCLGSFQLFWRQHLVQIEIGNSEEEG